MSTVKDDLLVSAASRPGHLAVADPERRLTYAELLRDATRLAGRLSDRGVCRGDRVVIVMSSSVECAAAVYGTVLAGACFVVLDATTPAERLVALLLSTRAKAVVCDAGSSGPVLAAAQQVVPAPRVVDGSRLPSTGRSRGYEPALLDADLAAIVFTSGSTGEPRGATFLHRNVSFMISSILAYLPMGPSDRILSVLPLSHTYGLYQLLMSVRVGATLHLRSRTGPVGGLLRDLREEVVTVLPGVPTLWHLLRPRQAQVEPLRDVRLLTNAGAALPSERVSDLMRLFPCASVYAMYGQTECARISYLPPELLAARPLSVGVPVPGTQVWLEDEAGRRTRPGEAGELVVRGPHVMQGYWEDPEATAHKLAPGTRPWERVLRTGDLFRLDRQGYLYFIARRDDVITTGGNKVAPLEVERVLCEAPGVVEVAVVGDEHPFLGEAVVAHVVAEPGTDLDVRALQRHCRERLEVSKVPRSIVLHQALPRLGSGKVDRAALRDPRARQVTVDSV